MSAGPHEAGLLRTAGPEDVSEIVRVVNAAYRVEDFFVSADRTSTTEVKERMGRPGAGFLVLDGPDGSLRAAVFAATKGERGTFSMLSVDPAWQGTGLGRRLLEGVEDHLRRAGSRRVDIDVVDVRHELPAFYARFGYRPTGTGPFPDPHKLTRPASVIVWSRTLE